MHGLPLHSATLSRWIALITHALVHRPPLDVRSGIELAHSGLAQKPEGRNGQAPGCMHPGRRRERTVRARPVVAPAPQCRPP
jgi:hypothetical protein